MNALHRAAQMGLHTSVVEATLIEDVAIHWPSNKTVHAYIRGTP